MKNLGSGHELLVQALPTEEMDERISKEIDTLFRENVKSKKFLAQRSRKSGKKPKNNRNRRIKFLAQKPRKCFQQNHRRKFF